MCFPKRKIVIRPEYGEEIMIEEEGEPGIQLQVEGAKFQDFVVDRIQENIPIQRKVKQIRPDTRITKMWVSMCVILGNATISELFIVLQALRNYILHLLYTINSQVGENLYYHQQQTMA